MKTFHSIDIIIREMDSASNGFFAEIRGFGISDTVATTLHCTHEYPTGNLCERMASQWAVANHPTAFITRITRSYLDHASL